MRRGLPPSIRRVLRVQSDLVVGCRRQQTRRHHLRRFGLEMLGILMVLLMVLKLLHVLLRFDQVFVHEVRLTEVV